MAATLLVFAGPNLVFPQVPDLAKLKAAAESGNADSQYTFAHKFAPGSAEWRRWLEAAAAQDDGRAEDELAWTTNWSYFATYFPDAKTRASVVKANKTRMREALLLASSAADKGFGRSRLLLGMAFANGYLVNIDTSEAYKWMKLSRSGDILADASARQLRDRLLKEMPLNAVEEGERRAASYRPGSTAAQMRTNIVSPLLKLTGLATVGEQRVAMINGVKMTAGSEAMLNLDGTSVSVKVVEVDREKAVLILPPDRTQIFLRTGAIGPTAK